MMYFESVTAAMQMDGHGIYVWVAYGMTAALLFGLVWTPSRRLRQRKRWVVLDAQRRAGADQMASGREGNLGVIDSSNEMEAQR